MSTYKEILKEKFSDDKNPSELKLERMVENAKIASDTELQNLIKIANDSKNEYHDSIESDNLDFTAIRRFKKSWDKAIEEVDTHKKLHKELFPGE